MTKSVAAAVSLTLLGCVATGPAFCGFFSGMDLMWRHWRIECTDEAEAHPDLRECKRQDLDEDSPWKP